MNEKCTLNVFAVHHHLSHACQKRETSTRFVMFMTWIAQKEYDLDKLQRTEKYFADVRNEYLNMTELRDEKSKDIGVCALVCLRMCVCVSKCLWVEISLDCFCRCLCEENSNISYFHSSD